MNIEGLNIEVLVVVRNRKGEMKFKWGKRTFSSIELVAFDLGSENNSTQAGIFAFSVSRKTGCAYFKKEATCAAFSMGGHYNGSPVMQNMKGEIKGGSVLSASDFCQGDRVLVIGHEEELTAESVRTWSY